MSEPVESVLLHASCVAIGDAGVLITGPSGAGKSDLALRLIDRGAILVADDCTLVRRVGERLLAAPPATIAGRIEVRGIGIVASPHREEVAVALIVALDEKVERLPDPPRFREVCGLHLPLLPLAGYEASAPIKVELALGRPIGEEGG